MLTPDLGRIAVDDRGNALGIGHRRRNALHTTGLADPTSWQQLILLSAILALVSGLSAIGAGTIARPLFIVLALATSWYYIHRRQPWHYVTWTLWLWTITAFVRRLIDFHAGFDAMNILLGTPNLITVFMLKDILTSRELLRLRESAIGLFLLIPILYGLSVSFVQGQVVPGILAAADWVAPLLYYFYFLANWRRIGEAELPFRHFLSANALVMGVYGLLQFIQPQPWDAAWVLNSGMVSIGNPLPFEIRVFGTLNSPGHLALWLSTILLLFLHFRTRITLAILPLVVLVLLITLVRSAAGSVIMGLVVAGFMGRPGMFRLLGTGLVACVLVLAGLSAFDPSVGDRVISRLDTVQDLGEDGSARARAEIYARAPDLLQEYPFGTGIGSTGRGAVGQNSGPVVFDAGPLEVFVTFGWVGGAVYLVGFILIMLQAIIAARVSRSPAALALAVAVVGGSSILIFSNISGFLAAVLWTCAAYAATLGIAARHQPRVRA